VGAEHAGRGLAGYSALQAGRRAARGKKITVCRGGSREWRAFMTMEGSMGAPASLANSWKKPGILGCGACLCSLPGDRHQDFKRERERDECMLHLLLAIDRATGVNGFFLPFLGTLAWDAQGRAAGPALARRVCLGRQAAPVKAIHLYK